MQRSSDENDKAVELFRNGRADAARALLESLVRANPQNVVAHVNLGYVLFAAGEFDGARAAYERAVALDSTCVQAYHGLSSAFHALGEEERSAHAFDLACRLAPIRVRPCRGAQPAKSVLLLCSASIANLNAYALLDDRIFAVTTAFVEYARASALSGHDVVFNAISEPERSAAALRSARSLVDALALPAINIPEAVRASSREINARRLARIDGARVPAVSRVAKASLAGGELPRGAAFPAIVRAVGHHDGRHMILVADAADLAARAGELPGDQAYVAEYVDVRSPDGYFRKYRMTIVGDELFPLHLAVSRRWKVHYVTSDMDGSAKNRAEDERFLREPHRVLGDRALAALHDVRRTLDLDYAGIDFSLDREGNAVIFEANASMFVPPVPNDSKWDYRRKPTARVVEAISKMLLAASSRTGSESASE